MTPEEINDLATFRALMQSNDGRQRFNQWVAETDEGVAYQRAAESFPDSHVRMFASAVPVPDNLVPVGGIVGHGRDVTFYI